MAMEKRKREEERARQEEEKRRQRKKQEEEQRRQAAMSMFAEKKANPSNDWAPPRRDRQDASYFHGPGARF